MTQIELHDILLLADRFQKEHTIWRPGQCLFNAIYTINSQIANELRGTKLDPFHNDDIIEKCKQFLLGKLDE